MNTNIKPYRRFATSAALVTLLIWLSGCTWVKKTPAAENVRIAPKDLVVNCVNKGTVTTNTVDNVSVVNRSAEKVKKELETLAQNEAAKSGADTIVALTKIIDGEQTFGMYRCL